MKLSVSTLIHRKLPLVEALEKIAALGVNRVELCVDAHHSDPGMWQMPAEKMLSKIRRAGIVVNSIHIPLPVHRSLFDASKMRAESTKNSLAIIDLAVFLSAGYVVQHVMLDSDAVGPSDSLIDHAIPALDRVAAYAQKRQIQLALENVPAKKGPPTLGNNPLEVMMAVEQLDSPAVGMCLDVSHCVASDHDPVKILQKINLEKLISLHVSDNSFDTHQDVHLPLGQGQIRWPAILSWLDDKGFNGHVVVEVAGDDEEGKNLVVSLSYLKAHRHLFMNFPP